MVHTVTGKSATVDSCVDGRKGSIYPVGTHLNKGHSSVLLLTCSSQLSSQSRPNVERWSGARPTARSESLGAALATLNVVGVCEGDDRLQIDSPLLPGV